jgi:hypothetical protein
VRNTNRGDDSASASDGTSGNYEVEDRQASRGSRASSVESEETDGTSAMGDSTDNSLLEPFRNLRLLGAGDVADNTRLREECWKRPALLRQYIVSADTGAFEIPQSSSRLPDA